MTSHELENVRALPRTQQIEPAGMDVGMQIWRERSQHRLRARLRDAVRRGQVAEVSSLVVKRDGSASVVVKVLKQPRSRVPLRIAGVTMVLGAIVTVGLTLWHYRYPIFVVAVVLAACIVFNRRAHSGACAGIHCAGCKG